MRDTIETKTPIVGALGAGLLLLGSAVPAPVAHAAPGRIAAASACGDLQARIDAAIRTGATSIMLPAKAVCLSGPLRIAGAHGLTIDGQGATLLFSAVDKPGIRVTGQSQGVTLTNVVLDYDPVPFTQGRIDTVQPGSFRFTVDQGYPAVTAQKPADRAYLFDATSGTFKRGISTLYLSALRPNGDGRGGEVPLAPRYRGSVQVGDLVVFSPRGAPAVQLDGLAEDTTLTNVTIHAAPGMAIMARFVGGRNRFNVRVEPGPRPAGATRDRLLSSNADAINYAYARTGPTIDHSHISAQGDDAVNLHGLVLGLAGSGGGSLTAVRPFGSDESIPNIMKAGDPIRILARDSFAVLATVRLRTIDKVQDAASPDWQQIDQLYPRSHLGGKRSASFYRISVEGDVPSGAGYLEFPALAANGFSITDNDFADSRGHAMVIGSSQGVIERNRIARITHNAIVLGPNFVPWREGGWVSDVLVRGNTVVEPCRDPSTSDGDFWSSATIAVSARAGAAAARQGGNRGITMASNVIGSCAGRWFAVSDARDVRVTGNALVEQNEGGSRSFACAADRAVLLRNASAVVKANNCITGRSALR
jgi:hypothetical protein